MTAKLWRWVITGLLITGCASQSDKEDKKTADTTKPNIVVILSDQERYPTHWPEGWAERNLTSMGRLRKNGLTFHKAYTAACECTPSRAVLSTSEHYPINKMPSTPPKEDLLPGDKLPDIGSVLTDHAGYDVVWKGKWHLSNPIEGGHAWTEKDIDKMAENYDQTLWNPPDAGTAITELIVNPDGTLFSGLTTLGGGYANNDGRYLHGNSADQPKETKGFGEGILDYIKQVGATDPDKRKPFCLFISFVNPHDVWVYPKHWEKAGYKHDEFADLGIDLPDNYEDSLTTKPSVQLKARNVFDAKYPLKDAKERKEYVNFYAHLNKVVDGHVNTVLDALDAAGLTENTIIFRTADHGEHGLSHGMREKAYTVYEEIVHVPLIVSNPKLFKTAQETNSFYCHLDLLPTIAELAGVPDYKKYGKGISIVPVLKDPKQSVQEGVLFTYDDNFFLPNDVPGGHIRAIREGDWTYAVYYSENGSDFEYEMYNLKDDPKQLHNLLYKVSDKKIIAEAKRLHQKLTAKIDQAKALPEGFPWPKDPSYQGERIE